jgi:nitrogenase molybdenum-cofactor synthesis protein NifE
MIDDMSPREMYKLLKDARADIMLSGGRSQFIALKAKMPWLDINQERHHAYMGYVGMVELVREIDKALSNPVWGQVRMPAPWDEVSWEERADQANAEEAAALAANPEAAREAERNKTVCNCNNISAGAIEDAILSENLISVEAVTAKTHAAGGCGSCAPRIAAILERINAKEIPAAALLPANEVGAPLPSIQAA